MVILMHLNLIEFKKLFDTTDFLPFEQIVGFIRSNYVMDEFFDGKNEIKFRHSGKTLVTIIMKDFKFTTLIIFGKDEREKFDNMHTKFSNYICNYYDNSKTYHDGKWMLSVLKIANILKKSQN
jgi:hypothetical protein